MDACIRVIFILYHTFKDLEGVQKPIFEGHTTFTIRLVKDEQILLLLEVKKVEINTDLQVETKSTAQAVREAYIVLQKCSQDTEIPFVLTNSRSWSFGLAKITENIISTKTVFFNFSLVTRILKKYCH